MRQAWRTLPLLFIAMMLMAGESAALMVPIYELTSEGIGESLGTIEVESSSWGVLFRPDLRGLPSGMHGFHLHERPNIGPGELEGRTVPGLAAGGHYDPGNTGRHEGPYGDGHLGDLPSLYFDDEGICSLPVLAPRLKLSDLNRRAIILHSGSDNYSDFPERLGGGGRRVAGGVIYLESPSRISPKDASEAYLADEALLVCAYSREESCRRIHIDGGIFLGDFQDRLDTISFDRAIVFY